MNPYGPNAKQFESLVAVGAVKRDLGMGIKNTGTGLKVMGQVANGINGAVLTYQIARGDTRGAFRTGFGWGGSAAISGTIVVVGTVITGGTGVVVSLFAAGGWFVAGKLFGEMGEQAYDLKAPGPQTREQIYSRVSPFLPR